MTSYLHTPQKDQVYSPIECKHRREGKKTSQKDKKTSQKDKKVFKISRKRERKQCTKKQRISKNIEDRIEIEKAIEDELCTENIYS